MNRKGVIRNIKKHMKETVVSETQWELEDGVLTLVGSGAMPDFTEKALPPWDEWREEIRELNAWNLTSIGARAFENCRNLTCVYLDNSVRRIGFAAFRGCGSLTEVHTPRTRILHLDTKKHTAREDALYFGRRAFEGTPWAADRFGDFYIHDRSLVEYMGSEKEVEIPEGVMVIENAAFEERDVEKVTFPASLRTIRSFAFSKTKLVHLIFPENLVEIERYAFAYTGTIRTVILENKNIRIAPDAFYETKFRHRRSNGKRKWGSIYSVAGKKERGIEEGRRLTVQRKKGPHMGVRSHNPGEDLYRRLRRMELLVRIAVDEVTQRVLYVQSFRWNAAHDCPETYLMFPCGTENGGVSVWRDSFTLLDDEDILRCDTGGLDGEGMYRWYVSNQSAAYMGNAERDLLAQWLKNDPEYRVDTREENRKNDPLRMFVPR